MTTDVLDQFGVTLAFTYTGGVQIASELQFRRTFFLPLVAFGCRQPVDDPLGSWGQVTVERNRPFVGVAGPMHTWRSDDVTAFTTHVNVSAMQPGRTFVLV